MIIRIITVILLITFLGNVDYSYSDGKVIRVTDKFILIDTDKNIGEVYDVIRIIRLTDNGIVHIGMVKIVKFKDGKAGAKIIQVNEGYQIESGDFVDNLTDEIYQLIAPQAHSHNTHNASPPKPIPVSSFDGSQLNASHLAGYGLMIEGGTRPEYSIGVVAFFPQAYCELIKYANDGSISGAEPTHFKQIVSPIFTIAFGYIFPFERHALLFGLGYYIQNFTADVAQGMKRYSEFGETVNYEFTNFYFSGGYSYRLSHKLGIMVKAAYYLPSDKVKYWFDTGSERICDVVTSINGVGFSVGLVFLF